MSPVAGVEREASFRATSDRADWEVEGLEVGQIPAKCPIIQGETDHQFLGGCSASGLEGFEDANELLGFVEVGVVHGCRRGSLGSAWHVSLEQGVRTPNPVISV